MVDARSFWAGWVAALVMWIIADLILSVVLPFLSRRFSATHQTREDGDGD